MAYSAKSDAAVVVAAREERGARRVVRAFSAPWVAAALVFLVALALNVYRLGDTSLWMDETFSVELARQPLDILGAAFTHGEPNMALYYLLLHCWIALLTTLGLPFNEFAVRLPSAVFAALGAVAVLQIGRRFLSPLAGVVAAALYALNAQQLDYALQARSYGMLLFLATLSWYFFACALTAERSRGRWYWGAYALASALAFYAQAIMAVLLVTQLVAFGALLIAPTVWRDGARQRWRGFALSLAFIGVTGAPLVAVSRNNSRTGWLAAPSVSGVFAHLLSLGAKGRGSLLLALALGALLLVAFAALAVGARTGWGRRALGRLIGGAGGSALRLEAGWIPLLLLVALWLLAPVVITFVISQGALRLFSGRYLVVVTPALCLLIAAGVVALRWRPAQATLIALLLLAHLALLPGHYTRAATEDWRTPVRWLERQYQPGDGIFSYNNVQGCEVAVEYYLDADGSPARYTPDSPGADSLANFPSGYPYGHFYEALYTGRIETFAANHSRVFFIEGRFADDADAARAHTAQGWLDARYAFLGESSSGVVTIRLYDTRRQAKTQTG